MVCAVSALVLAAQSSSKSLVVGWLVRLSVTLVKKWRLEYQIVTKTHLPSNLCDSSGSSDSCDSSDSSDSSDSIDSSGSSDSSDSSDSIDRRKTFFFFFTKTYFFFSIKRIYPKKSTPIAMKINNSNYYEIYKLKLWQNSITKMVTTQKLKLGQNSKTKIVTKLK